MPKRTETAIAAHAADSSTGGQSHVRLVAAGGILGALAASSCCILPLVLFSLGISGAWIGNLTALAPYKPYFVAGTFALLGSGITSSPSASSSSPSLALSCIELDCSTFTKTATVRILPAFQEI